jgi:hypothetical protein
MRGSVSIFSRVANLAAQELQVDVAGVRAWALAADSGALRPSGAASTSSAVLSLLSSASVFNSGTYQHLVFLLILKPQH